MQQIPKPMAVGITRANDGDEIVLKGPARPPDRPPLTPDEWVFLNPNDRVCVQLENERVSYATVDVVALDASVFWIWLDGGQGRVALHEDDDVSVWFEEEHPWLSSERPSSSDLDSAD